MTEKEVYVRKASGLVRGIGALDALFICLAGIAPAAGRVLVPIVAIGWPGVDFSLWLTLAAIMCIVHGFLFSQIGSAMPRSGGDYLMNSRALHPSVGFANSLALFIYLSSPAMGGIVPLLTFQGFNSILGTLGVIWNDPSLVDISYMLLTPEWYFIVGSLVILVTALILCLPMKVWLRIFEIAMVLAIVANVGVIIILATATNAGFVSAWNRYPMLPSYETVMTVSAEAGAPLYVPFSVEMTTASTLLGFWLFFGYIFSAYFAGEIKEYSKTNLIAIIGSVLAVYIGDILVIWPGTPVMGRDFITAVGWSMFVIPEELPIPFYVNYDAASMLLFPNPIWVIIDGIAMILQHITIFMAYLVILSRCMFAWSFDRILPEKVAYVSRWRSPLVAILIVFGLGEIGLIISLYTVLPAFFNWLFGFSIISIITAFACIIAPFRSATRTIIERAPSYVKYRIAGKIPILSIVGAIVLAWFAYMAYSIYMVPAISGPVTPETIAILIGLWILGLIIYYISRWYRLKTEGIDIDLASKAIPPA